MKKSIVVLALLLAVMIILPTIAFAAMSANDAFGSAVVKETIPIFPLKSDTPTVYLRVTCGEGGTSDYSDRMYAFTADIYTDVIINVTPDEGYEIDEIIDNGWSKRVINNPFMIPNIDKEHNIVITFKKIAKTVLDDVMAQYAAAKEAGNGLVGTNMIDMSAVKGLDTLSDDEAEAVRWAMIEGILTPDENGVIDVFAAIAE